jgi:hypothetical protein
VYRASNNSAKKAVSGRSYFSSWVLGLLCIVLLVSGVPQSARAQSDADEYVVKAAFLYHFAQFIDWPPGALDSADNSIKLCIFDDEPHRQELRSTIEGKLIGGRIFHVVAISQVQEMKDCSILFLSRDEARRQTAIVKSLRGIPVLTVGETTNFLSDGGMIRFHLEEGKIRFNINLQAAESSHLKIGSRLLILATSVTRTDVAGRGR